VTLPLAPPYPPMEALLVPEMPSGAGWQYEPKWDGFRCLAFRDGDQVELQSKAGQPLARYFPEVVEAVRALEPRRFFPKDGKIRLSPATTEPGVAQSWFEKVGGALDGVVAKRLDLEYRSGDRTGMQKVKRLRTADCVVGGFRYAARSRVVGSLLLGLYGEDGLLHHVGFTSGFRAPERKALLEKIEPLIGPPGFTGRAPGGPSRWNQGRSTEWEPLKPELVVEVRYDHFTGGRFRHGTSLLRWRPDKPPEECTLAQVEAEEKSSPLLLL
jgi:ATP-dependent DNA ligase